MSKSGGRNRKAPFPQYCYSKQFPRLAFYSPSNRIGMFNSSMRPWNQNFLSLSTFNSLYTTSTTLFSQGGDPLLLQWRKWYVLHILRLFFERFFVSGNIRGSRETWVLAFLTWVLFNFYPEFFYEYPEFCEKQPEFLANMERHEKSPGFTTQTAKKTVL